MSELRQDPVSGDWMIMAPERAGRPYDIVPKRRKKRAVSPERTCPFEHLHGTRDWPPIASYPNEKEWEIVVIPNKYPAVQHLSVCAEPFPNGPYTVEDGVGHHEMVVTRDHRKNFAEITLAEATQVLRVVQERYRVFAKDSCLSYALTFLNWGPTAGASLTHPHYQIVALPIVPPEAKSAVEGTARHMRTSGHCVYCDIIRFETRAKKRMLFENAGAVVFTPFTSRNPFEVRVFPRRHLPRIEDTDLKDLKDTAAALQAALRFVKARLGDPDLNFFIHSAPFRRAAAAAHYHWHIEILPKVALPGGFELGTGIDINTVDPDTAARILRGKK